MKLEKNQGEEQFGIQIVLVNKKNISYCIEHVNIFIRSLKIDKDVSLQCIPECRHKDEHINIEGRGKNLIK